MVSVKSDVVVIFVLGIFWKLEFLTIQDIGIGNRIIAGNYP